ncbi:MAG: AI-2E family transporter [Muribaculaceae bacterium]|nr:AI-2E family transporter [Muribaculaceae bacterium]
MFSSRPFTFDRTVRILFTIGFLVLVVWLVKMLANVLLPFCLACLIAYFLEPLCQLNMKLLRLKHRVIPTFLTLIETAVVIGGLIYLFTPFVMKEIDQMEAMIKNYSVHNIDIPFLPHEVSESLRQLLDLDHMKEMLTQDRLASIVNKGVSIVSYSLGIVFHTLEWFLMFIYVIFILIDYPELMKGFRLLVPPKFREPVYKVEDDIKDSMNRYFRVQVFLALCAAVFYCIGFSLVGIPLAIVLGILVGVLYIIPYFQYVTLIPVTAVCYISSLGGQVSFWPLIGKCILVYVVSQCICDYILTPKIMGKVMGLNPAIILLSLSVWGTLMGLIGMIIAIPLTTLLLAYYQEYIIKGNDPVGTNTIS